LKARFFQEIAGFTPAMTGSKAHQYQVANNCNASFLKIPKLKPKKADE